MSPNKLKDDPRTGLQEVHRSQDRFFKSLYKLLSFLSLPPCPPLLCLSPSSLSPSLPSFFLLFLPSFNENPHKKNTKKDRKKINIAFGMMKTRRENDYLSALVPFLFSVLMCSALDILAVYRKESGIHFLGGEVHREFYRLLHSLIPSGFASDFYKFLINPGHSFPFNSPTWAK